MPHRVLSIVEAAGSLHLPAADVERLVKRGDIPCEKRGRRVAFRKVAIEAEGLPRILKTDARPTNWFFLLGSREARQHLTLWSRLCRLAQDTVLLPQLRTARDAAAMHECLLVAEREVLGAGVSNDPVPFT